MTTVIKPRTKTITEIEEKSVSMRVGLGHIVLYTVPQSRLLVPAIVVEASKDGTATLQVFRTTSDGSYVVKNVRPDDAGAEGTYFA